MAVIRWAIANLYSPFFPAGLLWRVSMSRGALQILLCFLLQAVPLLQSGEVAEVAYGSGGFRAVAVVDSDGSAQCLDGLGVSVRRQDAGGPAQVSGQPHIFGPERLFRAATICPQ